MSGGFDFEDGKKTDYGYYGEPRWNDFSLNDEATARSRFSRFFLSVFIYLLVANLSVLGIQFALILTKGYEEAQIIFNGRYFVWIVQVLCMYVIAFPILFFIVRGMKSVFRSKTKMKISDFLVTFLIAEGLMTIGSIVANILTSAFSSFTGYELPNTTAELIENSPVWLVILVAVIIGPVVEELIFRKLLMDKLGMYGDRIAIIVSAISFGVFHGNLFQVFYAALLGALLAFVYSKTGNILHTIALHITINFFGSVVPMPFISLSEKLLEMGEPPLDGSNFDYAEYIKLLSAVSAYSMFQYGLAIAGIILLISKWKRKDFFVSDRCEVLIPKEKRASVIVKNAGAILFIIVIAGIFIINFLSATPIVPDEVIPEGNGGANIFNGIRGLFTR